RITAGDAEQVALDEHREAAAERLGDVADAAGRQRDLVALRHEPGVAVAFQADGFTVAGVHAVLAADRSGCDILPPAVTLSCTTLNGAVFHAPIPIPARRGARTGAGRKHRHRRRLDPGGPGNPRPGELDGGAGGTG